MTGYSPMHFFLKCKQIVKDFPAGLAKRQGGFIMETEFTYAGEDKL